jgi:hypothetical protein
MQHTVYTLCRIEDDASTTLISEHADIVAGIAAGKQIVESEDFDYPYVLHSNGTRLATFAEGRIGYREWARRSGRLDTIHSLDDRYDHDLDQFVR